MTSTNWSYEPSTFSTSTATVGMFRVRRLVGDVLNLWQGYMVESDAAGVMFYEFAKQMMAARCHSPSLYYSTSFDYASDWGSQWGIWMATQANYTNCPVSPAVQGWRDANSGL